MHIRNFSSKEERDSFKTKELFYKDVIKKLQTSFILPIAQYEEKMGHLWGNKEDPDEMTEEEYSHYEVFLDWRKLVLDNGNHQIRSLGFLFGKYDIVKKEG